MRKLLRRLFFWRPDPTGERQIFKFHDGQRVRHADPFAVWSKFEAHAGIDPETLLRDVIAKPVPGVIGDIAERHKANQNTAFDKLMSATGHAFEIPEFGDASGKPVGLTQRERLALVHNFIVYLGGLAEAARPFTSSPSATDVSPSA